MSSLIPPADPPYRISLFFGPEPVEGMEEAIQCVFNVKKRSWKAGIQVAVRLQSNLLAPLRERCGFDTWLASALTPVPSAEREAVRLRASDHFNVEIARYKLDRAIEVGLSQHNHVLPSGQFDDQLLTMAADDCTTLMRRISTELDLPSA